MTSSNSIPDMMDLMLESLNIKVNVDPTQGITTGEQHRYYPELGIPWTEGLNIVNGDNIIQRKFSELSFPPNAPIWIEEIDLGKDDPLMEGRYFYKLTTNFYENNYTSSSGFYKWQYTKQVFLLEKWFYKTKDQEVIWRPSKPIDKFPHTIRFNPGKALGLEIHSSEVIKVNEDNRRGKKINIPILRHPEISIVIENKVPDTLIFHLYGLREVDKMRRFHPINESIEDRETLIHPLNKDYQDRLTPPNKSFSSKFWNDPFRDNSNEVLLDRPILHPNLEHGFIEEE